MAADSINPVLDYAQRVLSGAILAGALVHLACQRHLDDLEHGADRGLRFDTIAAARAIKFFSFLRHIEGQFAGKPFQLMPFQKFIIGSLFGWKKSDGFRRFRTAYCEIGKGNGKTPLAAGTGLYGFVADGEQGAQVYSAAVTRDQANLGFTDAENMAKASPKLSELIDFNVGNMAVLATRSYFRPVSSEHRALDGKRVHMALIDELHEHPNSTVVDKIRAGTKARRQALIFEITNSGYSRTSVCYAHHEHSVKVLQGVVENDSWFAYICQLDPCAKCAADGKEAPNEDCENCDDWRDEATWIKANPGLDVILPREYLREQVQEAVGMPSKQNIVRRLNFCQWTEQAVRWIPMSDWGSSPDRKKFPVASPIWMPPAWAARFRPAQPRQSSHIDLKSLLGRACYGGLDLSSKLDLSAFVKVFPPDATDPCWVWLCRFFVPKENVRQREDRDLVPYSQWIREGFIEATPGDVVDYDIIMERIEEDSKIFSIQEIGFDPYNATHLATSLINKGFKMVEVRQGKPTLNEPCREFEAAVRAHKIDHLNNPVLRWNVSNVAVDRDRNDNIQPDKAKSSEKIDGVSAGMCGMARAIRNAPPEQSIYETRGILHL